MADAIQNKIKKEDLTSTINAFNALKTSDNFNPLSTYAVMQNPHWPVVLPKTRNPRMLLSKWIINLKI